MKRPTKECDEERNVRGNGKIRTMAAVCPETTVMFPARSGFMAVDIVRMTVADGAIAAVG